MATKPRLTKEREAYLTRQCDCLGHHSANGLGDHDGHCVRPPRGVLEPFCTSCTRSRCWRPNCPGGAFYPHPKTAACLTH